MGLKLLQAEGGSNYHWDTVKVMDVIKNDSGRSISDALSGAHYGWNEGVPQMNAPFI
jgi:hypothetical protein